MAIKMRAYDTAKKGHWAPEPQGMIYFDVTNVPSFINHTHNENGKWERRFEIMLCTGAKDANGKLIYQGDICESLNFDCELRVSYDSENCTWLLVDESLGAVMLSEELLTLKVVGDIYTRKEGN